METPKQVIRELERIRLQSEQGISLLAEAEVKYLELASAADRIEATELLSAQGTIVDRQAVAKLKAMDSRFEADLARAELNRIKAKIRHLSESQMAVMAAGKLIQIEWRG
jgi:multidrug resistance efflux pump